MADVNIADKPTDTPSLATQLLGVNGDGETKLFTVEDLRSAINPVRSLRIPLTAAMSTDPGAVCSVVNPEGVKLLLVGAVYYPSEVDDGSPAILNFGISNDGETSESQIYNGLEASLTGAVIGHFVSGGNESPVWDVTQILVGSTTAALTGWAAVLHVQYIRA